MQFLVTGGAGYLGSALVRRLAGLGHDVRVFDDLSAGDPTRLPPDVTFARGDVNDLPRLWTLMQGIDCVYHLAARVSVPESARYPREYNAVNVGGTVSVLEAMRDVGVKRLVFASSGAVYGNQSEQPLHEDLPPDPLSPYAVSKLASEHYIHTIGRLWNVETVTLRVFNAYGPGQQLPVAHPPVVPQFIRQTLGKGSVVIHGSGDQTRDFVYVDDVVDALVRAATAPNVDRRVINVGSGTETSIMALARVIGDVLEREPNVLIVSTQGVGVSRMCADLTLAKSLLGYEPHVFLQEGLRRTVMEDARFAVPAGP
ncbi:MAG TPA: NAD-dependent epimerase/dehydratase family protein [Aggregatilinea sp.]|uniref:NAD-dependent epimerase/dehydratase family protein n=1 Tax=Aggregatilinea sp. TaxID=2806333 RepID=UPI002CBE210C|nr:NAD-dependent epimerase/dehydratase family protein [Aggregatilinea sp.]HML23342.1 NAD-dependent epimerase/dehydratase family protein [Aggregatilinea sp.]